MPRRYALLAVSATISAVTLFGCGKADRPTDAKSGAVPADTQSTTVDGGKVNYLPTDFDTFYDEWRRNPAAAASKYSGRPNGVSFRGKVDSITVWRKGRRTAPATSSSAC